MPVMPSVLEEVKFLRVIGLTYSTRKMMKKEMILPALTIFCDSKYKYEHCLVLVLDIILFELYLLAKSLTKNLSL